MATRSVGTSPIQLPKMRNHQEMIPSLIEVAGKKSLVEYEKQTQLDTDTEVMITSNSLPLILKKILTPPKDLNAFLGYLISEDGIGTYAVGRAFFSYEDLKREAENTLLRTNTILHSLFPFPILRRYGSTSDFYCYGLISDIRGILAEEWVDLAAYFRGEGIMGEVGVVCLKNGGKMKVTQHEVIEKASP